MTFDLSKANENELIILRDCLDEVVNLIEGRKAALAYNYVRNIPRYLITTAFKASDVMILRSAAYSVRNHTTTSMNFSEYIIEMFIYIISIHCEENPDFPADNPHLMADGWIRSPTYPLTEKSMRAAYQALSPSDLSAYLSYINRESRPAPIFDEDRIHILMKMMDGWLSSNVYLYDNPRYSLCVDAQFIMGKHTIPIDDVEQILNLNLSHLSNLFTRLDFWPIKGKTIVAWFIEKGLIDITSNVDKMYFKMKYGGRIDVSNL